MGTGKKRLWVFNVSVALVCLIASAYLLTLSLLNSQNYIFQNGHWENSNKYLKLMAYRPVDAEWSRIVLANNQLNMSSLNGYQVFQTKNTTTPTEIQFQMDRSEHSYVDVIFNVMNRQGQGLRLSAHGIFSYDFDAEGKFANKFILDFPKLTEGVHNIRLEAKEPGGLQVSVDDHSVTVPWQRFTAGAVGFRGSEEPLTIDDVRINYTDGSVLSENFDRTDGGHHFIQKNFFIVLVLAFMIAGLFCRFTQDPFAPRLAKVSKAFLVFSGLWFTFDLYYLWRQPHANFLVIDQGKKTFSDTLERQRQRFFWGWDRLLSQPTQASAQVKPDISTPAETPFYCAPHSTDCQGNLHEIPAKMPSEYRVVLVGRSFFEGAGAGQIEESYFYHLHHLLQQGLPKSKSVSILNISTSRSSKELLDQEKVLQDIKLSQPDLIILESRFERYSLSQLKKTLEILKGFGVKSFCVGRALRRESDARDEKAAAEIFARSDACKVLSYERMLKDLEGRQEGFVHVDKSHATSYAQRHFANWLYPQVLQEIKASTYCKENSCQ